MRQETLPPLDERQRYTIAQTNDYLRQSNAKTYQQIKDGTLPTFKVGRRRYVSGRVIAHLSSG